MIFDFLFTAIMWAVSRPFYFAKYYFDKEAFSWKEIMTQNIGWNIFLDIQQYSSSTFIVTKSIRCVEPSIANWPCGKLSSRFHSDIKKPSIDSSNLLKGKSILFLKKLKFRCSKIRLLMLLILNSLRVLLAFETIVFEVLGKFFIL